MLFLCWLISFAYTFIYLFFVWKTFLYIFQTNCQFNFLFFSSIFFFLFASIICINIHSLVPNFSFWCHAIYFIFIYLDFFFLVRRYMLYFLYIQKKKIWQNSNSIYTIMCYISYSHKIYFLIHLFIWKMNFRLVY